MDEEYTLVEAQLAFNFIRENNITDFEFIFYTNKADGYITLTDSDEDRFSNKVTKYYTTDVDAEYDCDLYKNSLGKTYSQEEFINFLKNVYDLRDVVRIGCVEWFNNSDFKPARPFSILQN